MVSLSKNYDQMSRFFSCADLLPLYDLLMKYVDHIIDSVKAPIYLFYLRKVYFIRPPLSSQYLVSINTTLH